MRKNNNSVKNFTSKNFQGKKDNIINNQIIKIIWNLLITVILLKI